jgi:Icc-related predicted phosphoesterase
MIRIAAVGDLHIKDGGRGRLSAALKNLSAEADLLLLAGDLTDHGTLEQAEVLCGELAGLTVPAVAVLGNHDYDAGEQERIAGLLTETGVHVLEGDGVILDAGGTEVGIAGVKGFGGGFAPHEVSAFGEPEMKEFARHAESAANRLHAALSGLECEMLIALTHYAPVPGTLAGEPKELYPMLGSHLLGEAIDAAGARLAVHGHAHYGTECGETAGGTPVRNCAHAVIKRPYAVYQLSVSA